MRRFESLDHLGAVFPVCFDHRVLDNKRIEVARLVDFVDQLVLSDSLGLVHQESHDGLGHEIGDILLGQTKVRRDEVLDNDGFHLDPSRLLLRVSSHLVRDLWQDHLR